MSTKTRSGRVSKPPERFEPEEIPGVLEDDFLPDEYDSEEDISTVSSDVEYSEEEDCDDDEDDDSFIVEDDDDDDDEDYEPDEDLEEDADEDLEDLEDEDSEN